MNSDNKQYILMNVASGSEIVVSDGDSTLTTINLRYPWSEKEVRKNEQIIAREINDLSAKGYQLVLTNSSHDESNYIYEKK